MKNFEQEKAITLISLVITIILLLILSSVVLNLTLGEYGILSKTQEIGLEYKEQEAREKLELLFLELQADKAIDEKYNENEYIDTKIRDNGMEVEKNIIFVDGWKFEIDRSVPKIGKNLGQGETKITVEALASYVGTSSTTIKVTATSTEGNIVGYEYKLNGEVKQTTTQSNYTIENLEPTTTYKISVVAIDEVGNRRSSKAITITTKERTYIIKDGVQQIQGETERATITKENNYLKVALDLDAGKRGGYWFSYNLTNYKNVKIDTEVIKKDTASSGCMICLAKFNNDVQNEALTKYELVAKYEETNKKRDIYNLNIEEFEGNCIIAYLKNATSPATAATMYIYNLWLEE